MTVICMESVGWLLRVGLTRAGPPVSRRPAGQLTGRRYRWDTVTSTPLTLGYLLTTCPGQNGFLSIPGSRPSTPATTGRQRGL